MANVVQIIINATNNATRALNAPIKNLGDLKKAMVALKPVAVTAGLAAATAFGLMAKKSIDAADEMGKAAQKVGTTTEFLSTLKFAAGQAGVEFGALTTALTKFNVASVESAKDSTEQLAAFKALGISATNAAGKVRPIADVLPLVANAFQGMANGADKTAIAVKLFGRQAGPDLIPFLNQGAGGIKALMDQAKAMGLEISGPTARAAERLNDALRAAKETMAGAMNTILVDVLPALATLAEVFSGDCVQGVNSFKTSLKGVGEVLLAIARIATSAFSIVGETIGRFSDLATSRIETATNLMTGNLKGAWDAWKKGDQEFLFKQYSTNDDLAKIWSLGTENLKAENEKRFQANLAASEKEILLQKQLNAKKKAEDERRKKEERIIWNQNMETVSSALGFIASFSESKNKEIATTAKVFGIAQATMDTYVAANNALASIPFPYNIAAMITIIGTGLKNVAQISGVELARGGIVKARPGGIQATIGEGGQDEAVIPLDGNNALGPVISHATVELNGRTLLDFIWESSKNGMLRISPRAVYA